MACGKQVKLRGGVTYTVRKARDDYPCFYCNGVIASGAIYVEERDMGGLVRRYHYKCFNKVMPHRVRAVEAPSGVALCTVE